MAFRQTTFDPSHDMHYHKQGSLDMASMEEKLAREMMNMKIHSEKSKREMLKVCQESDELKELQDRIKAAYLNRERTAQIAETQFRKQQELERDTYIDKTMLEIKEHGDLKNRDDLENKKRQLLDLKADIQDQMVENEKRREEAHQEYLKEKGQVDNIIQKMIDEDQELQRINELKKEQAKQDMILSVNEKRLMQKRQEEMEAYENEMLRRYQEQQMKRMSEIQARKDQAEKERDQIFQELAEQEKQRRQQQEYIENLRNDLYVEEKEEKARDAERREAQRLASIRQELLEAKAYQEKLKEEKRLEEIRMEQEFKEALMQKYAEDEKLEQMNAQKRRMREQEHKRQIERLWEEKLIIYQAQRDQEIQEIAQQKELEKLQQQVISEEKERLLKEHAEILSQFNPKAHGMYK